MSDVKIKDVFCCCIRSLFRAGRLIERKAVPFFFLSFREHHLHTSCSHSSRRNLHHKQHFSRTLCISRFLTTVALCSLLSSLQSRRLSTWQTPQRKRGAGWQTSRMDRSVGNDGRRRGAGGSIELLADRISTTEERRLDRRLALKRVFVFFPVAFLVYCLLHLLYMQMPVLTSIASTERRKSEFLFPFL